MWFLLTEILFSEENTWVWACLSFPLTSLWARLFFLFYKNGNILPEKPPSRLLNGEKGISHLCESLLERGSYLGPTSFVPQPTLQQPGWQGHC